MSALSTAVVDRLKPLLEQKVAEYNRVDFIENDPVSIPHRFTRLQDIEIMGFFAATLGWGQRITIINSCNRLIELFDGTPHDFISNHKESDLKRMVGFKHRTFNDTDLLYFIAFLSHFYHEHESLEEAFFPDRTDVYDLKQGLIHFNNLFFSLPDAPHRTRKHVATPAKKSACKRLNMFLRWMVRSNKDGVDFGLWKRIQPSQLYCPFDVHVARVARALQLVTVKQDNWNAVEELTENLRLLDPEDPVKYDFALFGMGVLEKFPAD